MLWHINDVCCNLSNIKRNLDILTIHGVDKETFGAIVLTRKYLMQCLEVYESTIDTLTEYNDFLLSESLKEFNNIISDIDSFIINSWKYLIKN